mgnify:CR=1 FL=1
MSYHHRGERISFSLDRTWRVVLVSLETMHCGWGILHLSLCEAEIEPWFLHLIERINWTWFSSSVIILLDVEGLWQKNDSNNKLYWILSYLCIVAGFSSTYSEGVLRNKIFCFTPWTIINELYISSALKPQKSANVKRKNTSLFPQLNVPM